MRLVFLGKINKPHGLKGAVNFFMENKEDSQVISGKTLYINEKPYIVESLNTSVNRPILKLQEINSRTDLEKILPAKVYMDRNDFSETKSDEFYLNDILNFKALGADGESLGVVTDFFSNGVQDIAHITGTVEFDVLLVDKFLKEVDFENKTITILKPEVL